MGGHRHSKSAGFTLIEMLAALVGGIVVLSAGTGFMITAIERERTVLQASDIEEKANGYAQLLDGVVKTADYFQLYRDKSTFRGQFGAGEASGNFLVCWRLENSVQIYYEFEYSAGQLGWKRVDPGRPAKGGLVRNVTAANPEALFSMNAGLVQASWNVESPVDRIPFVVCAVPLSMH